MSTSSVFEDKIKRCQPALESLDTALILLDSSRKEPPMNDYNIPTVFTPEAILAYRPIHENDKLTEAFQAGKDAYYCMQKHKEAEMTEQEVTAYVMLQIETELKGTYDHIIPPSPTHLLGFCAGYIQEYLETRSGK